MVGNHGGRDKTLYLVPSCLSFSRLSEETEADRWALYVPDWHLGQASDTDARFSVSMLIKQQDALCHSEKQIGEGNEAPGQHFAVAH